MMVIPAGSSLADVKRIFSEAVFYDVAPLPAVISRDSAPSVATKTGVYSNEDAVDLMNEVAARYPIVRKLLCDDAFDRLARLFVTAEPGRPPTSIVYGEGFPRFIRKIGESAASDYLADIAELEWGRTRASQARQAIPVDKGEFAKLSSDQLLDLRVKLHPSVVLLKSSFPVVSIWESNHFGTDITISDWNAESVLIARPYLDVQMARLSAGAYEFFATLSDGRTVSASIARAMANTPDFDMEECFATLVASNIVVGFELPEGDTRD